MGHGEQAEGDPDSMGAKAYSIKGSSLRKKKKEMIGFAKLYDSMKTFSGLLILTGSFKPLGGALEMFTVSVLLMRRVTCSRSNGSGKGQLGEGWNIGGLFLGREERAREEREEPEWHLENR